MPDDFDPTPPPFEPDQALQALRRELRALGLSERDGVFERRGLAIARAAVTDQTLHAARVKRPARSGPDWIERPLRSALDARGFVADLKQQLASWSDRDD